MADIKTLLAEIMAGLEGLPPGPWIVEADTRTVHVDTSDEHDEAVGWNVLSAALRDIIGCEGLLGDFEKEARHIARMNPVNVIAILDHVTALEAENARLKEALARHTSDRQYVIGWNDGFEAKNGALVFPTMLRKMWSGGEVQQWIDDERDRARAAQGGDNG